MLHKTTDWLSMSLVAHQEKGFSLFHLFTVISGTFQPLLASYDFFPVVPFFTSNEVTECIDLQSYYESTREGNRFWQLTSLITQHFTLRNSWEVEQPVSQTYLREL